MGGGRIGVRRKYRGAWDFDGGEIPRVSYPLTSFLSLGERRSVLRLRERMMGCLQVFGVWRRIRPRRERTNDIGNIKTRRASFPLPEGEG